MHPSLRRSLSALTAAAVGVGLAVAPAAAHHRPAHTGGPPSHAGPPASTDPGPSDPDPGDTTARVVVAAVDSGINAYHEFFHLGGDGPYDQDAPSAVTPEVLAEFDIGPDQILDLTRTGDQGADIAADAEMWEAVEPGVPYWFEGTNVIAISFQTGSQPPLQPTPSKSAHGTGVASSVLEANPEAIVVAVEGINTDAEEWAFTHPATDIVTTSYGPIGSPPLPFHLDFSYTGVVLGGKVHTGAVDNTPALSPIDTTGGPWWSIGVSGYEEGDAEGRQMVSGSLPDLVADFTQTIPYCTDCQEGRSTVSGTSFATPTTAGVISRGVLEARRAAGHTGGIVPAGDDDADGPPRPLLVDGEAPLTTWDVRRALEEAAVYPSASQWDPAAAGIFGFTTTPVLDPAPWSTLGWGLVTADPERGVVDELLARLGVDGEPTREKSAEACTWMTAQYELRFTYWNTYAFAGESWLTDDDPYVRC